MCSNKHETPLVHTHTKTLSKIECMVIDESPSSLSSLAVMQMGDDLPVHLNVYISTFKQW